MLTSIIASIESESDRQFIEDIYLHYRGPMYRKALSILRNPHDADDAVETAMLKLINRIDLLRGCNRASLRSYLVSCAKNAAIDRMRRDARLQGFGDVSEVPDAADAETAEAGLLRADEAEAMAEALLRLPDRERELLRMKYYEELSDREIARLLGINSGSVRTYLTRARRKLGDILKEAENHV